MSQVRVTGCDVDGVGIWLLTHFYLRGEHMRCVVINVQQIHLKGACPAGRWDTLTERMRKIINYINHLTDKMHIIFIAFHKGYFIKGEFHL